MKLLLERGIDINVERYGMTAIEIINKQSTMYRFHVLQIEKLIVKHMVIMKSQGLFLSERNLNFVQKNKDLCEFKKQCEKEIRVLESENFDDSNLSCFHVLKNTANIYRMAELARNQNFIKVVKSNDFVKKFPIYGELIIQQLDKGILKNEDFELLKRFFNYLSTREGNRLPIMPLTCVSKVFNYLIKYDVVKLRNL